MEIPNICLKKKNPKTPDGRRCRLFGGFIVTDLHTPVVFPLLTLNKEMVSVKQIFKVMIKARQLRKMFKNKKVPPITC